MGKFVKGDVVVLPFPFSDLNSSKRRPALVVAIASADDVILAQITSSSFSDSYAVELTQTWFQFRAHLCTTRKCVLTPLEPLQCQHRY